MHELGDAVAAAQARHAEGAPAMSARFADGSRVRVSALHPPGHCRTPVLHPRPAAARCSAIADRQPNPEQLAYGRDGLPALPVYRVRFAQAELWPDYAGHAGDAVVVDLFEPWLEPWQEERP